MSKAVAKAFIPNPLELPEVNHKNGIKDDANVSNLEWVTESQNHRHRLDVLGQKNYGPRGERHASCKISDADRARLPELIKTTSGMRLAEMFGVRHQTIYGAIKRLKERAANEIQ